MLFDTFSVLAHVLHPTVPLALLSSFSPFLFSIMPALLNPSPCRFSSLTSAILLECSPLVIIECSVCICLQLVWKRVFCWLAPGGCTKKEQGIHKEECKKRLVLLYGRVPLDCHTQTKLTEQQERRPHKAALWGTQDSNSLPFHHHHTFLPCFIGLAALTIAA